MNESQHNHSLSQSTAYSEDVDSAATTLLATPRSDRGDSFDASRKYADIELEHFEREEKTWKSDHDDYDLEDSDDGGQQEADHLLTADLPPLVREPSATDTITGEDGPPQPQTTNQKEKQVSWSDLPRKGQLAILTLARMSEPLTQTSLQSYMFYQLKSFKLADGSTPSDATVANQAGVLAAAFTGAQFLTAIMWGRIADSERMGRKRVMLIGLLGSAIGSLGFGFSESFAVAVFWRALGGSLNGNVGVMRVTVSEIIKEKKFQSRAFLLMPITFNVGVIVGPLIGGLLADPVGSYPGIFETGGVLGGKDGIWWLARWPYALPNVVNAVFLLVSASLLIFGLEETLEARSDKVDYGLRFTRWVARTIFRIKSKQEYTALARSETSGLDLEMTASLPKVRPPSRRKLAFSRIWTSNVLFTLLSHGLLAMHVGTFSSLWFVFLSTPRYDPDTHQQQQHHMIRSTNVNASSTQHTAPLQDVPHDYEPHLPFTFTGGLALSPPSIGTALAILGIIGISLQLLLYPRLSYQLGTTTSLRLSLLLFPLSYTLTPFLSILPSSTRPPSQASGFFVWAGITLVLAIQVLARTFALPATAILVNNSCPHPSVLGTIHGIAQSVSALTRTVGPLLAGWLYGVGLNRGIVGLAWWCMAGVAVVGAVAGRFAWEGDGHEIWLEGEKEEEGKGGVG